MTIDAYICECGWQRVANNGQVIPEKCPECGAEHQTTETVRRYFKP